LAPDGVTHRPFPLNRYLLPCLVALSRPIPSVGLEVAVLVQYRSRGGWALYSAEDTRDPGLQPDQGGRNGGPPADDRRAAQRLQERAARSGYRLRRHRRLLRRNYLHPLLRYRDVGRLEEHYARWGDNRRDLRARQPPLVIRTLRSGRPASCSYLVGGVLHLVRLPLFLVAGDQVYGPDLAGLRGGGLCHGGRLWPRKLLHCGALRHPRALQWGVFGLPALRGVERRLRPTDRHSSARIFRRSLVARSPLPGRAILGEPRGRLPGGGDVPIGHLRGEAAGAKRSWRVRERSYGR